MPPEIPEQIAPCPEFNVAVAIVVDQGDVLVGIRDAAVHLGGYDEFPGGKCRLEESMSDCAIRECAEETGLPVRVIELLHTEQFVYPDRVVNLSFFLCHPDDLQRFPRVHEPFQWVPFADLKQRNFPPANVVVLQILAERFAQYTNRE